jgi:malonate transporter and related proteins
MILHVILMALAPIFFVMALGFGAGRTRTIDNHHVGELNAVVMDFALPASLFVATASAPRSEMLEQGPLFAVLAVAMLAPYLLWYFYQRRFAKMPSGEAALEALTVAMPNYAAAGLPIASAVLGPNETVPVAIAIAAGAILPSPLTLLVLELSRGKNKAAPENSAVLVARALWRTLTKPIELAPVTGILSSLSGLKLGDVIGDALQAIGQASGGIALFLTGLILSAQPFRLEGKVLGAAGTANVARPLLVAAIVSVFPVPSQIAKVSILLAAMPLGFFGILFAANYKLGSAEVGSMVIASTVLSILTLRITIAMLFPQ